MTQAQIYIYGIDLGKNWFHLVAMERMGHVLTKQKLTRSQLKQFISTTPPCRVAFEACPGSQYWGRLFQQTGFEPKIIPAHFVKPYLKSNKNDFNDATAIAEAIQIAAIGNGSQFKRARDLSAWLGLVPRQYSTGGKSSLGGISKRGNSYLRQMVIQGAKALKIHMKRDKSSLGEWVVRLEVGHHHHVVLIALANKIMRICWKVLTSDRDYQPYPNTSSAV